MIVLYKKGKTMLEYVENRIWFLGHIFNEECSDYSVPEIFLPMQFNNYSDGGEKLAFTFSDPVKDEILKKLNNIYAEFDLQCTQIIFDFLKNGCVNIKTKYLIGKNSKFLSDYDNIGGSFFQKNSDILFEKLELLREEEVRKNHIILNENMTWGIPNILLNQSKNNYNKLQLYSVLYIQNIIFENELDLDNDELKNVMQEKNKLIVNSDCDVFCGWGIRLWKMKKNIKFDDNILDSEIVYLSKKVITIAELNFFTVLSQKLLYDNKLRDDLSVDSLEFLISSYRTLYQVNDLISQDFDEFTNLYNAFNFKNDNFSEYIDSKSSSETTLLQLAKNFETKKIEQSNQLVQFILTIIGILTVYSVITDVTSFLPIDDQENIKYTRIVFLALVTTFLLSLIYFIMPSFFKKKK